MTAPGSKRGGGPLAPRRATSTCAAESTGNIWSCLVTRTLNAASFGTPGRGTVDTATIPPHPEEGAKRPSRSRGVTPALWSATPRLRPTLRDAPLHGAPQGEAILGQRNTALMASDRPAERLAQRPERVEFRAEAAPVSRLQALDGPVVIDQRLASTRIRRTSRRR